MAYVKGHPMSIELMLADLQAYGLTELQAQNFQQQLAACAHLEDTELWQKLATTILTPELPFVLHEQLYALVYSQRNLTNPGPAWFPEPAQVATSNLHKFMQQRGFSASDYAALHTWAKTEYAQFWQAIIAELGIKFDQPYTDVVKLDAGNVEYPHWLCQAKLNIAQSCFRAMQEHNAADVANNGPIKPAIIYQDYAGKLNRVSYAELDSLSNRVANGLVRLGLVVGDVIAIAMPMTVEAVAIYLGIVKAGCVVAGIADSFAPQEIATRITIANAKAIFTQDVLLRANKILPLYAKVVQAQAPLAIVLPLYAKVVQAQVPLAIVLPEDNSAINYDSNATELRPCDITWQNFLSAEPAVEQRFTPAAQQLTLAQQSTLASQFTPVPMDPEQHMNILFSSGTTGTPKAIPWDHTAPIKVAADGFLHVDIHAGDVVCWPTNLGWMMGPWLIFATFINRATMALYYDAPTSSEFINFIEQAQVTILGVVPSIVKHWRHNNYLDNTYWQHIRLFASTGEASNSSDMLFLMSRAKYKPIIEYCGGTEISGAYVTSTVIQPNIPATFSTPALGLDLVLVNDAGEPANPGEVALIPPSIGLSRELLNADHHQIYYSKWIVALH